MYDNETGIYIYFFGVGTAPCQADVLTWRDPHHTLRSADEWTRSASINNIDPVLKEGFYYLTVKAFNNIVRGGPLVTSLCNTIALVVDITKPIINSLDVGYDDPSRSVTYDFNVTDSLSDIYSVAVGLGYTPLDENVLPFAEYFNRSFCSIKAEGLQEGVFMYGRVRARNNVMLSAAQAGERPLFLDYSPPLAGDVYDGYGIGVDIDYTYVDNEISANWDNFVDPQSGIEVFQWAVAVGVQNDAGKWMYDISSPNSTVNWLNYTGQSFRARYLFQETRLSHNTMYFSTIIAYNAGVRSTWKKKKKKEKDVIRCSHSEVECLGQCKSVKLLTAVKLLVCFTS